MWDMKETKSTDTLLMEQLGVWVEIGRKMCIYMGVVYHVEAVRLEYHILTVHVHGNAVFTTKLSTPF